MDIRTRIAPSPTGFPHIGTIYQALFDWTYAKKHNGTFIVRIEDTDQTRYVEGAEEVIYNTLDWFNLSEDESPRKGGKCTPYRQSERLEIYHKYAQELIDNGHAYFSYYPKEGAGMKKDYSAMQNNVIQSSDLSQDTPKPPISIQEMIERGDWVVRMKVPKDQKIVVRDEIRGDIEFDSNQVTEQVLIKSDGFPTYHLAVVVDDHLMEITDVVRGEEWITSFPKHKLLYDYFGWQMPKFYHTPVLRNPDKSKLSKRHGHTSVQWYKEEGFLPEAILNFLALMGWSNPIDKDKEIFSIDEFVEQFELKDIRPVAPIFDLTKLTWMNGIYLREKISIEELKRLLLDFYINDEEIKPYLEGRTADAIVALSKTRMRTLKDFRTLILEIPVSYTQEQKNLANKLKEKFQLILEDDWKKDNIFMAIQKFREENNIPMKDVYWLLTAKHQGLPLPDMLEIKGKKETIKRLESL